jgi:hypothetical protein
METRTIQPPESGVPIPPISYTGGRPALYKIEDLSVGDSRLFTGTPNNVRASVWPRAKALGWRMISRKEAGGVRVWRVK